jgi:hypothetical protein
VLAVRETTGHVLALLQGGKNGLGRDCYEVLPEQWMTRRPPARATRMMDGDYDDDYGSPIV